MAREDQSIKTDLLVNSTALYHSIEVDTKPTMWSSPSRKLGLTYQVNDGVKLCQGLLHALPDLLHFIC